MNILPKIFITLGLLLLTIIYAEENKDHIRFLVELKMDCPPSLELQECMNSVPTRQSETFEEWKDSLVKNLYHLIILLESGKIHSGQWTVRQDEPKS